MRANLPPAPDWEPTEPDRNVQNAMNAIAKAHDRFTQAAPDTFDPDRSVPGSNYNVHHLDMEATGSAEDAFAADVAARLRQLPHTGGA